MNRLGIPRTGLQRLGQIRETIREHLAEMPTPAFPPNTNLLKGFLTLVQSTRLTQRKEIINFAKFSIINNLGNPTLGIPAISAICSCDKQSGLRG